MLMPFLWPALIIGAALSRAHRDVDEAFVEEWAQAHALTLTPGNRPMVTWYLHNARVLRAWGVLAGLVLPSLASAALGSRAVENASLLMALVGYMVGALYAEVALVRPAGAKRVATLVPRELKDYLPRRLLMAQRLLGPLVLAVAGAAAIVHTDWTYVVSGVLAAAFALALPRIERWLVQRPQPFTAPDLVAADDAIRSQSMHSVAGSGVGVLLLPLGGALYALDKLLLAPAVVCFAAAVWACLYYGHRAWRVRRALPNPAPS